MWWQHLSEALLPRVTRAPLGQELVEAERRQRWHAVDEARHARPTRDERVRVANAGIILSARRCFVDASRGARTIVQLYKAKGSRRVSRRTITPGVPSSTARRTLSRSAQSAMGVGEERISDLPRTLRYLLIHFSSNAALIWSLAVMPTTNISPESAVSS
jgi:hypothetical protein